MPIHLFRYSGDPLDSDALLNTLGVQGDYTYLVATSAMERARQAIAPPHQRDQNDKVHLVFHKALRHWLREQHILLLTHAEERVALLRAAEQIAQDPTLAQQLRHDVFAWRDALAELAARNVDLSQGWPVDLEAQLVNPRISALLLELQTTYQNFQRSEQRQPFEDAASAFLANRYSATSVVILEGFTFFTPLQRRFIDIVTSQNKTVILLYPYRTEQSYGFEIMRSTYGLWLNNDVIVQDIVTDVSGRPSDLRMLQTTLFNTNAHPLPTDDGSVEIRAYGHRHQEVAACIQRLQQLIQGGVSPNDIAIVTRNAGNIEALLREEADLQGLPVSLSIPPRQLLLTPLGRFALTLYQIWRIDALHLNAEQLETLLASGWLGADVQATSDVFSAVRAQFFARCESDADWEQCLTQLLDVRANHSSLRLATHLVDVHTLTLWQRALRRVRALCRRLFASGQFSIGDHVRLLLDELAQLAPEEMRDAEREVLLRIEEALMEVASTASLEMSAEEFGGVLNSLVQDYKQSGGEDSEIEPSEQNHAATIWVTTPEGIDGQDRKHIFYLGVDSHRAPRAYMESWPFYEHVVDKHQQQERYLFLTVVRAARQQLYLSYARVDEGEVLRPSSYLEEVCALLGENCSLPSITTSEPVETVAPRTIPMLRARRSTYSLSEIAHAGLCPYRYKLERLSPAAGVYRDSFQIRFLAEGVWLNAIMGHQLASGRSAAGVELVYQMFLEAMDATRLETKHTFPGLRELDWHTIEQYVVKKLRGTAQFHGRDARYNVSVVQATRAVATVNEGDRTVRVDSQQRYALQVGQFPYFYIDEQLFEEWLLPGAAPADRDNSTVELADGTEVFASLYHAVQWWRASGSKIFKYTDLQQRQPHDQSERAVTIRANYIALQEDLRIRIAVIEGGSYPKHPGDHCRYCPVHLDCLGLEP